MTAELVQWRRPGCDDRCWRAVVLVVSEQQTRSVDVHDADAHEDYVREAFGAAPARAWRGAVRYGPLTVDFRAGTVSVLSMPVTNLTPRERDVLHYLARNAGRLILYAEITEAVWGREYVETGGGCFLRNVLSGLRRKLWEAAPLIETVNKRGIRLRLELP